MSLTWASQGASEGFGQGEGGFSSGDGVGCYGGGEDLDEGSTEDGVGDVSEAEASFRPPALTLETSPAPPATVLARQALFRARAAEFIALLEDL